MWQDIINGAFELLGGVFVFLHCWKLYKDKKVRGVSFIATGYFTIWGFWNMYYYPFLRQWMSLFGGLLIVAMNVLWVGMMIHYIRKERREKIMEYDYEDTIDKCLISGVIDCGCCDMLDDCLGHLYDDFDEQDYKVQHASCETSHCDGITDWIEEKKRYICRKCKAEF